MSLLLPRYAGSFISPFPLHDRPYIRDIASAIQLWLIFILPKFSQGSAVIDNAIQKLDSDVRDKVKGVVLFGFTRNLQDGGRIPNYPKDQTKVFCAVGDMVCDGTLIITAAHLTYGANANEAATFLASKVK